MINIQVQSVEKMLEATHWVHKKCSGIMGALNVDHNYQCSRCLGLAHPIDNRPTKEWHLDDENKLDVADSFCYLVAVT